MQYFLVNIAKLLRTNLVTEYIRWLLLSPSFKFFPITLKLTSIKRKCLQLQPYCVASLILSYVRSQGCIQHTVKYLRFSFFVKIANGLQALFLQKSSLVDVCLVSKYVSGLRDSHRYSVEKAVLKIFAIFTGKHLCQNLFLTKLQAFFLYSD